MKSRIIISGFGGQGVMLAGRILAEAAIKEDKFVTFYPSYGAEMRGGTANCQVIVSNSVIGSPVITDPNIFLIFNKPSYDKFRKQFDKEKTILINSDLCKSDKIYSAINVSANQMAEECGSVLAMNMVMIGAFIKETGLFNIKTLKNVIAKILSSKKPSVIELNQKALFAGYQIQ